METKTCSFCGKETIMIMLGNGFMIPIEPVENLKEKIIPHVLHCQSPEAPKILKQLQEAQEEGEVECPECKEVKQRKDIIWIAPQVAYCEKCEIIYLIDQDMLNYSQSVAMVLNQYAAEINGVVISTWKNTERELDKTYSDDLVNELRNVINRIYRNSFSVEKSNIRYMPELPQDTLGLFK